MRSAVRQQAVAHQESGKIHFGINQKATDIEQKLKTNTSFCSFSDKPSSSNGNHEESSISNSALHDFSKISIFPNSSFTVQPKLKINSPNDKYEQEADRVAEQLMRMPEQTVQRKCAKCGKEEELQRVPNVKIQRKCAKCEQDEEMIQTKSNGDTGNMASPVLMNQIQNTRVHGQVMDANTLSFMEPRFGMDFRGVRIHADNRAAAMSQRINAKAFTVGRDIYFNQGAYNPDVVDGKKLLAHELTHMVQQHGGDNRTIQRQNGDKKKEDPKKKEKVKTKVEVVTEHDFSEKKTEAKASTTRSTEEEVAKGVTASASEKVAGDKTTRTARLKAKNKMSGLFASSTIKVEDPTDPILANTHKGLIKVGGSWMLFNSNLKLGTSSSLEFAKDKNPKWSVDGSAVFFSKWSSFSRGCCFICVWSGRSFGYCKDTINLSYH